MMETPISRSGSACPPATLNDRSAQLPALQLSKIEFLKAFSPVKCLRTFKEDSAVMCASNSSIPTAFDLKKTYGEEYLIGYVKLWIINCFEYFDKKPPEGDRLEEGVLLCLENRYYLNLADINLIFKEIKRTYQDVSLPKIRKVFEEYTARRADEFYTAQLSKDDVIKKHGYAPQTPDDNTFLENLSEKIIDCQMEAAKRVAQVELVKLQHEYKLSNALQIVKNQKAKSNDKKPH